MAVQRPHPTSPAWGEESTMTRRVIPVGFKLVGDDPETTCMSTGTKMIHLDLRRVKSKQRKANELDVQLFGDGIIF
jgi:hypothetical protein